MKINIIGYDNGVGLTRDAELLSRLFSSQGHQCLKWNYHQNVSSADLNIHLEVLLNEKNFPKAPQNVLVPNLEWFYQDWIRTIDKFTVIWCKTANAFDWFKSRHGGAMLTSFESEDMRREEVQKNPKLFIHMAGKSTLKGTDRVIAAWIRSGVHQQGYELSLIGGNQKVPSGFGIQYKERIGSDDELKRILNAATFHLCPSEAEGWGHYIHEAKSTGGVVITTDAPPMNTIVGDSALLLPYSTTAPHHCGVRYFVPEQHIEEAILRCTQMSENEIVQRGKKARTDFEESRDFFRQTVLNELSKLS